MRTLFDIFIVWPMPAVWVLLLGLIVQRWRWGRFIAMVGALLLVVGMTPVVGNTLLSILERGAPTFDVATDSVVDIDAIVVPLAGAYEDPAGEWWPMPGSVDRAVRGQQLQAQTGLSMFVIGGAPLPGQAVPEAVALQRVITLGPGVKFEATAKNTFETARVVADRLRSARGATGPPRVIIVTDGTHVTRMAASLRRFGVHVVKVPPRRYEDVRIVRNFWLDLVPSARGAGVVRRALHEYTAIGWYLVSRRIRLRDL